MFFNVFKFLFERFLNPRGKLCAERFRACRTLHYIHCSTSYYWYYYNCDYTLSVVYYWHNYYRDYWDYCYYSSVAHHSAEMHSVTDQQPELNIGSISETQRNPQLFVPTQSDRRKLLSPTHQLDTQQLKTI